MPIVNMSILCRKNKPLRCLNHGVLARFINLLAQSWPLWLSKPLCKPCTALSRSIEGRSSLLKPPYLANASIDSISLLVFGVLPALNDDAWRAKDAR